MKTTIQRLRQAERTLEQRRRTAEQTLEQHRKIAYEKIPKLAKLERELAQTGSTVVNALWAGENAASCLAALEQQNTAAQAEQAKLLTQHGFAPDYLKPQYTCGDCRDTGFVRGLRCGCFTKLLQVLAYQELSMDTPLEQCTFDSFSLDYYANTPTVAGVIPRKMMQGVLDYCKQYAAHFTPRAKSMLFLGPTGLGKTHLSLAIAREIIEQGHTVIYGAAQNLLSRLEREHFARYGQQSDDAQRALLNCDLLIIDDLGTEFSTSFTQSCIYNIVNTRLMSGLPVIINTNLNDAQLEEKYGERVTSRIIGNYAVLRFFGNDVRQQKK